MPWSTKLRRLCSNDILNFNKVFSGIRQDLYTWAAFGAGTLPRHSFVFDGAFDEDMFGEVREKRLATLLSKEVQFHEKKWLNFDFEEAQVKVDLTDMVLEQLIVEAACTA